MVEVITRKRHVTASEVTDFVEKQKVLMQPMRTRMEEDFALWGLDEYEPDASKGAFERFTTNRPRVFADKVIEELASAPLKFTIPIFKDRKSEREACSKTEQAVIGLLSMANDSLISQPFSSDSQSLMAFYASLGRFVIPRFWMYEDTIGGEKVVVPDLAVWDGYNTYWTTGKRGIKRMCYVRYASVDEVQDLYDVGDDVEHDDRDRVLVKDQWDENFEDVVIGGEVVYELEHGRGYVPARVFSSGSAPLVQHDAYTDEIKHVNESVLARSRGIWKEESQFISYLKTQAVLGIRSPIKKMFDSTKLGTPIEFSGNPYKAGADIDVDVGKGQDLAPMFPPVMVPQLIQLMQQIVTLGSLGSGPDILYGRQEVETTAQGTAMLIHAAMTVLKTGKRQLEQAYTWFANEAIRQYKDGKWKDIQVQGVDHSEAQFAVVIERDKLVTDRRIEASLNIQNPQDEMENVGKAIELKKSGLMSDITIQDKILKLADTDAEAEKLVTQKVEALTGVNLRRAQKALIDAKDYDAAAWIGDILNDAKARVLAQMVPPPQMSGGPPEGVPGGGAMPGMPRGAMPGMMPGKAMQKGMPSQRVGDMMRFGAGRPEQGG